MIYIGSDILFTCISCLVFSDFQRWPLLARAGSVHFCIFCYHIVIFFSNMPKIIVSSIIFFKLLAIHSKSDFSFLPLIHILVTVCLG